LRRKNVELEEQNQRVQQANRLKSEFLANMSHELRTPLNSILGFSEILHDGKVGAINPKQKDYISNVLSSARHLLQLINDVLDLSKVEAGKMEFFPEPVDPKKLAHEVREILRTLAARKRLHLEIAVEPSLVEILVDPGKLKQVLFNYLSNAIKFSKEDGHVSVAMRPDGSDFFVLEVSDTGIGIKPEDTTRLFVEFQQLDGSVSKKYQGTGLGLALTKRIVEAQGGAVGLRSVLGEGSIFFARLPRMQEGTSSNNSVRQTQLEFDPSRHSVLVIEDNANDRGWIVTTLEHAGYIVNSAPTGDAAIRLLGSQRFDAITLDLLLPDMNGWDLLKELRREGMNRATPVVMTTVVADKSAATAAVDDYLLKPIDPSRLLASLAAAGAGPHIGKHILILDDELGTSRLIEPALREWGYEPTFTDSGATALGLIQRRQFSAVVVDLVMPEMGGYEFLDRLRNEGIGLPAIVMTAADVTYDELKRIKSVAQLIVHKGVDGTIELLEVLHECTHSNIKKLNQ
jgi:CheY-like chemotaxis protein/nitrogen-specific signal transduction histidine kinase